MDVLRGPDGPATIADTGALPYLVAKQARLADIEAQLDGGGDFVDVLAARTGGASKVIVSSESGINIGKCYFQNSP